MLPILAEGRSAHNSRRSNISCQNEARDDHQSGFKFMNPFMTPYLTPNSAVRSNLDARATTLVGLPSPTQAARFIIVFLLTAVSVFAREQVILVPKDASESAARDKLIHGAESLFVAKLQTGEGTLFKGTTLNVLPAGRYRLHVPLSLAPFDDESTSGIQIMLQAGQTSRQVNRLHFAEPDAFTDVSLDFVLERSGKPPISVSWQNKRAASVVKNPGNVDAVSPGNRPGGSEDVALEDAGELVPRGEAFQQTRRFLGAPAFIEPLSPLEVTSVKTDKIVYRPGETGAVDVVLRNFGTQSVQAELKIECQHGLSNKDLIATATIDVPAGGSSNWHGSMVLRDVRWGAEVMASARLRDGREDHRSAVFAVAKNFWEVALIAAQGPNSGYSWKNPDQALAHVQLWRQQGFTGFECFFWAECDFSAFTPTRENFFSGQTQYAHSITGTKNLIAAAHQQGMVGTVYSNLWGTDGAAGYETMRRHPEWIANGGFNTEVLDYWPRMEAGKIPTPHQWFQTNLVQDDTNSMAAVRHHAAELVGSHRQFGWDAVRYDSYYSSEWTKKATKLTRELVEHEVPDFQFGYNSFATEDAKMGALDIMVGGGGMIMAEGIRMERSPSLKSYTEELITWRDLIWPHHGHLGPIYAPPTIPDKPQTTATGLDAVYVSSIMLATGSHPYYHPLEGQIGQHQRHALRYAEIFWDNRMRPVTNPKKVVSFGAADPAPFFCWEPLVRKLNLGGDRRRLVIHLLNIPENHKLYTNQTLKTLPVIRDLPLTVRLPIDAQVAGAWNLCAIPESHHRRLAEKNTNGEVVLRVPELRFWQSIVIDYTSKEELP